MPPNNPRPSFDNYQTFGDLLNRGLQKADRSPSWLALQLSINRATVNRWVNSDTRPNSPEMVAKILKILQIPETERKLWFESAGLSSIVKLNNEEIQSIGTEIATRGGDDVLTYLGSLSDGHSARYEAKLLIIGEGGTGKSSILRALLNLPFDAHLPTTHGIAIQTYRLPHPAQTKNEITLNVWDFGGQHIYHTTHQFFMTQRSLYLLVWNARGNTEQGKLDHWLRNIEVLAPDAPIFLVATHIDEHPADFNYARFEAAYPQLVGWVGVSNKTGEGIDDLRSIIAKESQKLTVMGYKWPQKWLNVEIALHQNEEYYISNQDFVAVCIQNRVEQPNEQTLLGGYLHDLGKILYFQDDDALSDFVVLKPNWLTETMACVLDDKVTRDQNQGVLYHTDFARLWPSDTKMKYARKLYPLFYRLLERFLICYRLEDQLQVHVLSKPQSLIPLLLSHALPTNLTPWQKILPKQPEICMLFKLDFVPPGMMSWFIVLTHRFSQNLQWREGVRLQYREHQAQIILNPSTRELWLSVRGPVPSNFFNILHDTINDRIIHRYFTGLKYERKIPCTCHALRKTSEPCLHFFNYDTLVKRLQHGILTAECENSFEQVSVLGLLY